MKRYLLLSVLVITVFFLFITGCGIKDHQFQGEREAGEATAPLAESSPEGLSVFKPTDPAQLKVHFLDVGQADAILIQLPDQQTMLIDAGNNDDGSAVVSYLQQRGINKINYLVGTHPHEDHIGGLDEVINTLEIGQVYLPKVIHNTKTFEDVLLALRSKGLKVNPAHAGVTLLKQDNLKVNLLSPAGTEYKEINDWSVVIRVQYGDKAFLLTGDAEIQAEEEMLAAGLELQANILKVGHHGSRSSTTSAFLAAVAPEYAVISVGRDNDYGHPHAETLARLAQMGVQVYRTDVEGTLVFTTDGQKISIERQGSKLKTDQAEGQSPVAGNEKVAGESTGSGSNGVLIGNKRSKIFHQSTCSSLPVEKNRVYYATREEALSDGLAPCINCKP